MQSFFGDRIVQRAPAVGAKMCLYVFLSRSDGRHAVRSRVTYFEQVLLAVYGSILILFIRFFQH